MAKSGSDRAAFLVADCAGDAALRARPEALLDADVQPEGVLAETARAPRQP